MRLPDIAARPIPPTDWDSWTKIPWDEPGFSARMLENHLSQAHDWASRTAALIDRQAAFIHGVLPANADVLDLGCGPGLYTEKLRALGHRCVGVDFSPASIAYAKKRPGAEHIEYVLGDIRSFRTRKRFDAVLVLFGEINVFSPNEALAILQTARSRLKPGGKAFVEAHHAQAIRETGCLPATWTAAPGGLFSERPHLCLEEHFWNEERAAAMTRYYIVDAETAACSAYASLMQAYTQEQYAELFRKAGFQETARIVEDDWPTGAVFAGTLQCFLCCAA